MPEEINVTETMTETNPMSLTGVLGGLAVIGAVCWFAYRVKKYRDAKAAGEFTVVEGGVVTNPMTDTNDQNNG